MDNSNEPVNPSETSTQPQSVISSINNQKGYLPIMLGILALLVVVGGGAYYLGTQRNNTPNEFNQTQTTPLPIPQITQDSTQKLTEPFQEIMDKHCRTTKMMNVEDLPVIISSSVASKIVPNKEFPVGCPHGLEPLSWNAAINNDDDYTSLAITDNLKSTAIIGVPAYRKLVKDTPDGQISLWYQDSPYDANKDTIYAVGEKPLKLSNEETIYVRFGLHLMDKSNPRFKNVKTYDSGTVNNNTVDSQLYTELTKESPEKDNLALIEDVLKGVTSK